MHRKFCIPGIIFLTAALVLLIIVSISLPFFSAMDFVRVHFGNSITATFGEGISQLRFGIWSFCFYDASNGNRTCSPKHHAYSVGIRSPTNLNQIEIIGASWTRGLAIHPVAAAVTFVAFLFSFSTHVTFTLVASLLSFLAAAITFIAFLCDIALYAFVHNKMGDLDGVNPNTDTGPAFWLTFVSFILLLLAGCTVCFGRRRARMDGASSSYPMTNKPFWKRFRRGGY
ncbi:pali-domain-containing protein [Fomitiporia mediterranea MF3/22]|uniref:pali-domain-containing protein n=1 Tax=Fomitiporia mediterranea (strain MF3/22) TaxID=694068 RepID=UPI0004408173|nr:pali-domain-containing protein [Fomitiporia mediterranea MF3/22]EJD04854.1 pali-domain-containing protein [Fomitiporia mediterranea MF3/22]